MYFTKPEGTQSHAVSNAKKVRKKTRRLFLETPEQQVTQNNNNF